MIMVETKLKFLIYYKAIKFSYIYYSMGHMQF
jgi:hypothetical protein